MASAGDQIILNNTFSQNIIFILSVCLSIDSSDFHFCSSPHHPVLATASELTLSDVNMCTCTNAFNPLFLFLDY